MFKYLVTIIGEKVTAAKDVIRLRDEEWAHKLMMYEHKVKAHKSQVAPPFL